MPCLPVIIRKRLNVSRIPRRRGTSDLAVGLFPIHTVFLANKEINQEKVTIRWLYQSYQSEWAYKAVRLFQFKDPYFTDHILYFIFKGI